MLPAFCDSKSLRLSHPAHQLVDALGRDSESSQTDGLPRVDSEQKLAASKVRRFWQTEHMDAFVVIKRLQDETRAEVAKDMFVQGFRLCGCRDHPDAVMGPLRGDELEGGVVIGEVGQLTNEEQQLWIVNQERSGRLAHFGRLHASPQLSTKILEKARARDVIRRVNNGALMWKLAKLCRDGPRIGDSVQLKLLWT
jgi:hypothetical protein